MMKNTSVSLQDESWSLLILLDPASLYPWMIQVQEAEVEDGADDSYDVEEQKICASVRQFLVAVPLQW